MNKNQIPIGELCCESWEGMTGDDTHRFCDACQKEVVDLSAMSKPEAKQFLRETKNSCIRYTYNAGGEIYFIPVQLKNQRRGAQRLLAAAVAIPLSLMVACGGDVAEHEAQAQPAVYQAEAAPGSASAPAPSPIMDRSGEAVLVTERRSIFDRINSGLEWIGDLFEPQVDMGIDKVLIDGQVHDFR